MAIGKSSPKEAFHEAEVIWKRLYKLFATSGHTHQSIADAIGTTRTNIHRMLHGDTHLHYLKQLFDFANACNCPLWTLTNPNAKLPNLEPTGIKQIDTMIKYIYQANSLDIIFELEKYAHSDYRMACANEHITVQNESESFMTLQQEREHNTSTRRFSLGTQMNRELIRNYIVDDQVIVFYKMKYINPNYGDGVTRCDISQSRATGEPLYVLRVNNIIEHLTLDKPIDFYRTNKRNKPLIVRRHWANLPLED